MGVEKRGTLLVKMGSQRQKAAVSKRKIKEGGGGGEGIFWKNRHFKGGV